MAFRNVDLRLVDPPFNSKLTGLIMDLDHLRRKVLGGTTPPHVFFQIKTIFHIVESVGSARIEGNRTTVIEYIDSRIEPSYAETETIREIRNMETAMDFIDENIESISINRIFLSELHKRVVEGLAKEGSRNPGRYRKVNIDIAGSSHTPPDYLQVEPYMNELFRFLNTTHPPQYDLLKTAIAHHRFVRIHPFDNGNGRTVRLLTYAMLVKQGFRVDLGRLINPTAVFCINRDRYYENLSMADKGDDEGLLNWCDYVLKGLKGEVEKIDRLTDYDFLKSRILMPAIKIALERKYVTERQAGILTIAVDRIDGFKNSDLKKILPSRSTADISRLIRKLIEKRLITRIPGKTRRYTISLENNFLLRGIMTALDREGFLPVEAE